MQVRYYNDRATRLPSVEANTDIDDSFGNVHHGLIVNAIAWPQDIWLRKFSESSFPEFPEKGNGLNIVRRLSKEHMVTHFGCIMLTYVSPREEPIHAFFQKGGW